MGKRPVSLRIPEDIYAATEEEARRKSRDFSSVANEMLTEAVRMRRIPGIVFGESATGRVAMIAGTGLKVWLVIEQYRAMGENWEHFKKGYPWLNDFQLRAALAYAEAYPEEIDEHIRRNEYWTPERLYETYPFMKPPDVFLKSSGA